MKTCTKCHETKPKTEFSKNSKTRDGLQAWCKACQSAAYAKWLSTNHDNRKAIDTKWRAVPANIEKRRVAGSKYLAENPAMCKESSAKSRAIPANRERRKAYHAKWRAVPVNRAKVRASSAKSKAANPEARRIQDHTRRARKRGAGGKLSKGLAARLFAMQRGKCACCGKPLGKNYHLDHVMPLKLGGTNTDNNIQLLLSMCNQHKHAKHPVDFMQAKGFLL